MSMNKKKFVFLMTTPDLRVEWSGNETAEYLTTVRFPPRNKMHDEVKRFCERAKAGDFLQTYYNFIFCSDDKKAELGGTSVSSNPTIYIAGKITGLDYQESFNRFERAENTLRILGYEPINPMKAVDQTEGRYYEEYLADAVKYLCRCDAIYLLSNWFDSKGARIEFAIAKELGLNILFQQPDWLEEARQYAQENEKLRKVIASRGKAI